VTNATTTATNAATPAGIAATTLTGSNPLGRRNFVAVEQLVMAPDAEIRGPARSNAELVMRRVLCIPSRPAKVRSDDVYRAFNLAIILSGLRCLLGYVVFPIVSPALGAATGVGPALGIPIGIVALVFDVVGIRRFWIADHRWRWNMTLLYAAVMALVSVLLVRDIVHIAS
jgi:hypothetical protein